MAEENRKPSGGSRLLGVWLSGAALALSMTAPSLSAQGAAAARVTVRVPPISRLQVEPVPGVAEAGQPGAGDVAEIRVRANHGWQLSVVGPDAAGDGDGDGEADVVWVRATGSGTVAGFQAVEAGASLVIATGGKGETVVRVEVRSGTPVDPTSLTYALSAL